MNAKAEQLRRGLELAQQKMALTRPMVASRAVSEREIIDLESEINRMDGDLKQSLAQIARVSSAILESEQKVSEIRVVFNNELGE